MAGGPLGAETTGAFRALSHFREAAGLFSDSEFAARVGILQTRDTELVDRAGRPAEFFPLAIAGIRLFLILASLGLADLARSRRFGIAGTLRRGASLHSAVAPFATGRCYGSRIFRLGTS